MLDTNALIPIITNMDREQEQNTVDALAEVQCEEFYLEEVADNEMDLFMGLV